MGAAAPAKTDTGDVVQQEAVVLERDGAAGADQAELAAQLRRRERELSAISAITSALHRGINPDELERKALQVAVEVLDASGGTIYVHDPQKHELIFKNVVSADPDIVKRLTGMRMPDNRGVAGAVFQAGVRRAWSDDQQDTDHDRTIDKITDFVTEELLTVPLRTMSGAPLGVMQVVNKNHGNFDETDWGILEILSAHAASAIETARLYEEARRASVVNLIGDISHDVKNMLTPVETGTQTLELMMDSMFTDLDGAVAALPEEKRGEVAWAVDGVREFYKEAMTMVYDGANDAQERVREIADAIKGITSQPLFEGTDFRERVEAVAKYLKVVAERKGVAIDIAGVQDTGLVEMDRKSIYNAVYNLVNNAIPETPEGGMITVRSRLVEQDGEPWFEFQVADTGGGMPEHVMKRINEGDPVSTKPGGTGLGTRIVRNVVEAHHGTMRVDSVEGKGTTFTIRIPVRQPTREPAAAT